MLILLPQFFDWTKPVPPAFDKFLTENGIDTVVREGGSPTDSGNNQADEVEVQHVDDATVRDAIKKVLDTGKKGTALQEAASGVLSSYPAEQSARQLMRLVLEVGFHIQVLCRHRFVGRQDSLDDGCSV